MEEEAPESPSRPRRRWWRMLGVLLLTLLAIVAATVAMLDTGPGHRLIADRVARLTPSSGLRIRIGRIDGSIWRRLVLRDVRLSDPRGRFFAAPEIRLDWHPLAWAHNRLDIDRLAAGLVELDRLPKLRGRPGAPLLPGFDIRIGRLEVARLRLGRDVAGTPADMRLVAHADLRDRRAAIGLAASSTRGDRATLDLDAAPDEGRFRLAADISSPTGGVIGGLAGTRRPLALVVGGRGDWRAWDGRARAILSGGTLADLALQARAGRYALSGDLAPAPFVSGKLQRLSSPRLRVSGAATYAARLLDGHLAIASPALALSATGKVDLATSSFGRLAIDARLLRPPALFPNMTGRDVRLRVGLDGPFKTAAFTYALTAPHVAFDDTGFDTVRATGAGHVSRLPIALPIRLSAARVTGLGDVAGGILARLAIAGTLKVDAKLLTGEGLALTSDKLRGRLGLRLDLVTGQYDVALSGGLQRYLIPGLGIVDVDSRLSAVPGPGGLGTIVAGRGTASVRRFDNAFLASLAGGLPRIETALVRTRDGVLHLSNLVLTGPAIRITGSGIRRRDGSFQFEGAGRQATYGPFRIRLDGQIDHPQVRLVFDRPVDGLGLRDTNLDLDPVAEGFTFRAGGRSYLGPFRAAGLIRVPPAGGTTTIEIAGLDVSGTHARGILRSDPGGFTGVLNVAGGGIVGTIGFVPEGTIQRIEPKLTLADATLAAEVPVRVRRGTIAGAILLDPAGLTLSGQIAGQNVRRGGVSLARLAASAKLAAGRGSVTLAAAGSRGRAFDLKAAAAIEPGRATITGGGTIDQRPVALAGPAIVTAEGAGYRLAPAMFTYDGGKATLAGRFATDATSFEAGLDRLPLTVLDIFAPQLGLAGQASGKLAFAQAGTAAPTGRLDITLRGLSRSGLVRSSQPIDLAVAAALTPSGLAGRAVALSNGATIGRAQLRIAPLGAGDGIVDRLTRAPLFAQLRYAGPGDTLWRLAGIETIDLSGPFSVAADIGGTLDAPAIRGVVKTDGGRLESAVTGTVVEHIQAAGRFDGSRLLLDRMSGTTPGGGTIAGKGSFDLSAAKGLGIDLALQADDAVLLARDDIGATVTGPLTIRSSGVGGTIGGTLVLDRARYKLGAAAAAQVAHLAVSEVNQPEDLGGDVAPPVPWTLDLTARARNRLAVTGLGLDSEWRANLTIKGAVDNPAIGGEANLIQGRYEFAGRRFDIARGVIRFSGSAPPDPALDITAQANIQGLNASIRVTGTGLRPEIGFESVPALPEDELLARLLFGTSIANLSAPEALQLASAVASLRSSGGGGGFNLDPINAVRRIAHLDRLRILPADVTTGQKTAIAAGKYIGRRTYVEVVTDGAGYSATTVEYRITRWLSVLSSISTIGRQSANVRVSKDY